MNIEEFLSMGSAEGLADFGACAFLWHVAALILSFPTAAHTALLVK
jgi:hypothetical protein